MIFKQAIDDFLNRPLRDLSRAKNWSDQAVERRLWLLDPKPVFYTAPRQHQKISFLLLVKNPYLFCMHDMGLGKTKIVLDARRYLGTIGRVRRTLVLVPNIVNLEAWRLEISIHAPDLEASYISGTKQDRMEAWETESALCISTYAGVRRLLCSKRGKKFCIDNTKLRRAKHLFDSIVWDESTALLNHRSLDCRIARQLSRYFRWRVALTGTPLGRDPQALWAQFYCVDRGIALGETLGLYRAVFFKAKENFWGGSDYTFKKSKEADLRRMMACSSLRYSSEECLDLPDKVPVKRPFVLPEEARAYYSAIIEQVQKADLKPLDLSGVFVKLRQICSGFIMLDGQPSALLDNPKLESLLELLDDLPSTEKVVVFNEFIYSGDLIATALKERKISSARLYSGSRNKVGELRRFTTDPKCQVFIVNSQSGAQGLNLQQCHYVVVYESPVNPIIRQQLEKRCHRPGQKERVFIYDLYARNTVEQKILGFLAEGKNLLEALVEGKGSKQLLVGGAPKERQRLFV